MTCETVEIRNRPSRRMGVCECGEHCWFELTRVAMAFSDADQWPVLSALAPWRATKFLYAERGDAKSGTRRLMHRVVLGTGSPLIDHIDRNCWNNRLSNLRAATTFSNPRNRRKRKDAGNPFKGVIQDRGKFRAQIRANGKRRHGPRMATAYEAALDYDDLARLHHGSFAATNVALGLI